MKKITAIILLVLSLSFSAFSETEPEDDHIYTLKDESGQTVTCRSGRMYIDDEYISGDNMLYVIKSVDDEARIATARLVGKEPDDVQSVFAAKSEENGGKKLVCMYSTHSDESYVPSDGESSLIKGAGIYDVGNALKENLEKMGIDVVYSDETFLPHDAGAYRRSRGVAAELLEKNPDALIDIHRDGVPAEQYETNVEGDDISMVRLFVGKSNANAYENRAFAKQLKAVADEEYPGLVKDIYIGKGNYNQDLYPQAILLEFGTHEIEKEKAIGATEYMAHVLDQTLYGANGADSTREAPSKSGIGAGVGWLIGLAVAAAILFALFATGTFKGAGEKMRRGYREMTGGAFTKKKDGEE